MTTGTTVTKERGTRERSGRVRAVRSPVERPDVQADGDASRHLEELLVGPLQPMTREPVQGTAIQMELIGPHLRLAGLMGIGHFQRLSDFVNHHEGLLELRDATVLRRNGDPTRVTTPSIWVSPDEVTLMGQAVEDRADADVGQEMHIDKVVHTLIVITPGHTLTGNVPYPRRRRAGAVHRVARAAVHPDDRRQDAFPGRSADHLAVRVRAPEPPPHGGGDSAPGRHDPRSNGPVAA